ncbi:GMP synthase (glutamine-hydrolyzing) [Candidatus Woesearchaeota archaeon B3_Woes]|nr:MAG: GMP synthase (glutamine-hydrolyzing) [Candidatus Woesearchaeota archaeon B3_Woes]
MTQDEILVLDFGGQYTQLIAKSVRKSHVFSEILPFDTNLDDIVTRSPKGIILSGGPESVYEENAPLVDPNLFNLGIPVLGICYGMQLTNHLLEGGTLYGDSVDKEYGETDVSLDSNHPLFSNLDSKIRGWMSHGDSVDLENLAEGFRQIAMTTYHVAGIANDEKRIYGVQFHPEVTHTEKGLQIISNFVHNICGCSSEWTMENYIEQSKEYIRETVGNNDVLCFVSGGVDSTYVASLLAQTDIPGKKYFVYIDALMRKGESEEVIKALTQAGVENLIVKYAEDRFIDAVKGMSDPEDKRKAIGNLFGTLMQEVCEEQGIDSKKTFLAQGTLYTDLIESGKGVGKKAANIKSHHNVGCKFIEDLREEGRIVEPNRLIFKDEIREAARAIGLPLNISERQPYPGPGLGIRIVDSLPNWVNKEFYRTNDRVKEIASEFGLEGYVLPVKTVGVQGDNRTYTYLALLRGGRYWNKIREAAQRIPKEIHKINRIVYDIGNDQIDQKYLDNFIQTQVTRETIDQLKEIDYVGREVIYSHGFTPNIAQTIFVLSGADVYDTNKRMAVLRAVTTDDFMTVSPVSPIDPERMSWECLDEIGHKLKQDYNVGAFVIDVTDKPPATTCWE